MTETKLTDLLERSADQTPVGPPPLDALRAGAARRRHRRTAGLSALAAAAVAAVIAGTNLLPSHPPTTSPTPAPIATRLVGFGHAAIAVPADWPTNQASCGTPTKDTVLIDDPSAYTYCARFRASGVESVQLVYGIAPPQFHADETFEIDGVRAQRQRTTCSTSKYFRSNTTTCVSTVFIPSLKVWFRADSSTNADEVGRILDRIAIVTDQTGVPSYQADPRLSRGAAYADVLKELGFKPQIRPVRSPSYPAGQVLGVSPATGTMLKPGATVTVTVAK
ncbi:PASTA domain-containing protein [Kribbella sp. NBC_00709]|uniref:PASTA domain-containing protein n=1 Tax=Kribbella sp. NBC_00709 TaxID=2975972 RepID=UPI002E2E77C8|nr:PASTA domain-containing protein [Kribbella sp. NBC_00709]